MSLVEQVFGKPGYSTDLCLNERELVFFQTVIGDQWLGRLRSLYPELMDASSSVELPYYHVLSDKINHKELWHKKHRLLSQDVVQTIKTFDFMRQLQEEFGLFSIAKVVFDNAVDQGREEIYWRLVRPGVASDIGPLHADKWFHNLVGDTGYGMFPPGTKTVKIWMAIHTEPGLNGLLVVPNSHKKDWENAAVEVDGHLKPCIKEDIPASEIELVPTEPGRLIIFNEKLLHTGCLNRGATTRVSTEITMVLGPVDNSTIMALTG